MASIEAANLSISVGTRASKPILTLKATCKVVFVEIENCIMSLYPHGKWFALEAHCYAEEHPHDHAHDQELFFLQRRIFPADDPANVSIVDIRSFSDIVDDDFELPDPAELTDLPGTHEIYVRLMLFNMFSNTLVAQAETNVVRGAHVLV